MPRMYQLPKLFVRGSIFNQTAANLDDAAQVQIVRLMEAIQTNRETVSSVQSIRARLYNTLACTIGSEYSEARGSDLRVTKDRPLLVSMRESFAASDAEFQIIIWKAALWVYHTTYTYQCQHCGANSYIGTEGRKVIFDRAYEFCPVCSRVEIEGVYYHKMAAANQPHKSPIQAMGGTPKVQASQIDQLINDPRQLCRLVSQFSKGYIHQILRENKVKYDIVKVRVSGPADYVAHQETMGVLGEFGIKAWPATPREERTFCISTSTSMMLTSPHFTMALLDLIDRYAECNVKFAVEPQMINIWQDGEVRFINAEVLRKTPKLVVADTESIPSDDGSSAALERNEYSLDQRAAKMLSPASQYESIDMVTSIRADLYDPQQVAVFDIMTEGAATPPADPQVWDEYLEWRFQAEEQKLGLNKRRKLPEIRGYDIKPRLAAEFLHISHKRAEQIMEDVRVICLAHGLNHRDRTDEEYSD